MADMFCFGAGPAVNEGFTITVSCFPTNEPKFFKASAVAHSTWSTPTIMGLSVLSMLGTLLPKSSIVPVNINVD